jgi:hypothetical protein
MRTNNSAAALLALTLAGLSSIAAAGHSSNSPTLWVASTGQDSGACGPQSTPCRSISQAIRNAIAGATIIVGVGAYGDLNKDGDFDDPGEEHSTGTHDCVVCVDKSLKIFSSAGPLVTTIDAGGIASPYYVVAINANNVVFGGDGYGFTVTGGQGGLAVGNETAVSNVRVSGNVALDDALIGFAALKGVVTLDHNVAVSSEVGFGGTGATAVTLRKNVASGDVTGFAANAADHLVLTGNIASHNFSGFETRALQVDAQGNSAVNNQSYGFTLLPTVDEAHQVITGSVVTFHQNTVAGNELAGVLAEREVDLTAHKNNFFGNGTRVTGAHAPNCGVLNKTTFTVDATNNYWGAATGPGPDPADAAGGACDFFGETTTFTPFRTTPVSVLPR